MNYKKPMIVLGLLCLLFNLASAQDATGYQTPPKVMADLLLAKPTPSVLIDSKGEWMVLLERNSYPSVEELAQPEYKIAGLRINPNNFAPSRQNFIRNFSVKNIKTGEVTAVTGLPAALQAGNVSFSPDEKKVAFTQTNAGSVDLYILDISTKKAVKINTHPLNIVLTDGISWIDGHTLLYKVTIKPASAAPHKPLMPDGPTIQQSLGKTAPSPTYQDLIKSPFDEKLFAFFATAQLVINKNGTETPIGQPAIYLNADPSPDKKYLLIKTVHPPFSYLVTAFEFPSTVRVTDLQGKPIKLLAELPSGEGTPSGYDNTQNIDRNFQWREDVAATVTWAHPLDSGLIKNKVDFHDAVYALAAPFNGAPATLFKTKMRYQGIYWGNNNIALVSEILRSKQSGRMSRFNPETGVLETLNERNLTDAYNDPGRPVLHKNSFGREVITTLKNGSTVLLNNTAGSSPKGDLPFLSELNLDSKQNNILWRCSEGYFEYVTQVIDPEKLVLITRKESQKDVPNYYIKNLVLRIADQPITAFTNPYPQLEGVVKQKVSYKRADGVDLTGDLYLPAGYNKDKDGPLPVLIWAYPREFNSAADAAQIRGSQSRFTLISWASPIFFVTQGFAVLDNAEMPIVSTGENKKPNDDFVHQLQLNAEAAIQKLSDMGVGDKDRVAVGGHSYGAFMTANLLAHTNLFKAGIARSGAYNRTLTPFGFQNEDRTYWQAPQLYYEMSPFSYADKIKTPLLLIHGDADDNTGTFPINSERLYNAIKGNGGTVRFVFLPYEAHGYRGKENLLHLLWEEDQWLEKYVKKPVK